MSSRWVSKPPIGSTIDYDNPLSDFRICWLMNERGGVVLRDLKDFKNATPNTVMPYWRNEGLYLDGTANQCLQTSFNPTTQLSGDFTFVSFFYPTDTAAAYKFVFSKDVVISLGTYGTQYRWGAYFSNTNGTNGETTGTIDLNKWQMMSIRYDGNLCQLVKNGGNVLSTKTIGVSTILAETDLFHIGCFRQANTNYFTWKGYIRYILIYNRSLSNSDLSSLYESPYQFVKGPSTITYFTPPAAGGWTWGGEVKNVMVA